MTILNASETPAHSGGQSPEEHSAEQSPHTSRKLPEYASHYLQSLVEEYRVLKLDSSVVQNNHAIELIEDVLKKPRLGWGDIFVVERAVLRLQPADRVRRRAWSVRDKYRVVVGEQAFAEYMKSSPPDPAQPNVDVEGLRADIDQLLGDFHWLYQITPVRERVRNHISREIAVGMFIALLVIIGAVIVDYALGNRTNTSTFLMILFMGAMGAFVSLQHRIQKIPTSGDAILNILALKDGAVSVILSPISGAVFAFVLYLGFSAGVIQGALFPQMMQPTPARSDVGAGASDNAPLPGTSRASGEGTETASRQRSSYQRTSNGRDGSFAHFVWLSIPSAPVELAKLLLWCFIAGFAERLVPDTLDRMIARKVTVLTDEPPSQSTIVPVDTSGSRNGTDTAGGGASGSDRLQPTANSTAAGSTRS